MTKINMIRVYLDVQGISGYRIQIIILSMIKQGEIDMKTLPSFILTLFLAFMAVAILPACSSTDEQPSSSAPPPSADADDAPDTADTSEPPPPSGGSEDDCILPNGMVDPYCVAGQ